MKYLRRVPLLILLAAACLPVTAGVIFQNGFNGGTPGLYDTISPGGSIGPWAVGGDGVDWIHTFWQHAEGDGSVDLSAVDAGSVSTTLATVAGRRYRLSFYLAANPFGEPVKSVQVTAGNLNRQFDFNWTGASSENMGWILITTDFTADGNDLLTFASLEASSVGPALDLVTVQDVPEPGTYFLVLAGLTGLAMRRRRR